MTTSPAVRIDLSLPRMERETPAPQRMPFPILVLGDFAGRQLPMSLGDRREGGVHGGKLPVARERLRVVASPEVERRWTDLAALTAMADATPNVTVEFLAVNAEELLGDFEDYGDLTRSGLYMHLISSKYGGWTGEPRAIVVLDLPLVADRPTAAMLRKVATVCGIGHATLLLRRSAHPEAHPEAAFETALAEPLLANVIGGELAAHLWVADPVTALAGPIATYGLHDVPSFTDMRLLDALVGRCIKRLNIERREPHLPQVQAWLDARTGEDPTDAFREARATEGDLARSLMPHILGRECVVVDFVPGSLFPAERRRVVVIRDLE